MGQNQFAQDMFITPFIVFSHGKFFFGHTLFVNAQSETTLYFEPSSVAISPGDETIVSVKISSAENIFGIELHIMFDPTKIQIIDEDNDIPGAQLLDGDFLDVSKGFLVVNEANKVQKKQEDRKKGETSGQKRNPKLQDDFFFVIFLGRVNDYLRLFFPRRLCFGC